MHLFPRVDDPALWLLLRFPRDITSHMVHVVPPVRVTQATAPDSTSMPDVRVGMRRRAGARDVRCLVPAGEDNT